MIINILLIIVFLAILIIVGIRLNNYIELNNLRSKIEKLKEKDIDDTELINIKKYYINLEKSKVRNNNMIKEMVNSNMKNYERVESYDGSKIKNPNIGDNHENHYNNSSLIELSITMSHIKAIKKAYDDKCDKAIIMEDDVEFSLVPFWPKKLKDIISEIPDDCDILLLANRMDKKVEILEIIEPNGEKPFTGVCYLITKKGMDRIIKNHFRNNKLIFEKKDGMRNIIFDQGFLSNYKTYTLNQSLFLLDNFKFKSQHISDSRRFFYNYIICDISKNLININIDKI